MIDYKYCTQCKAELNLVGTYPFCPVCNITYYKNSKPCVGILPVKDGKVLLSIRGIEPYKGKYDIIGGFLEDGEDPIDGIKREFKEETGLDVDVKNLLGIYVDVYGEGGDHTLNMHYIGEITGGEMKAQEDVESLHWIAIKDLPLNEGFENMRKAFIDLQKTYV